MQSLTRLVKPAILIVAIIHIAIAVVEIFFWMNPIVHERLGFTADVASQVAPIVQNAGLYNSFIAAGLIWGALARKNTFSIRLFFLICVAIAGIFGAITLKPTTLVLQSLPAAIALLISWLAFSSNKATNQRNVRCSL